MYAAEWDKQWNLFLKDLDKTIVIEQDTDKKERKKGDFILSPFKVLKKVFINKGVGGAVGIAKGIAHKVGGLFVDGSLRSNLEYLKEKKYYQVLDMIDPKILKSRMIMGPLLRESKEATGHSLVDNLINDTNIRDFISQKWCLLISSKPLLYEEASLSDEETLEKSNIPPDMDFDTLYMFDEECDHSGPTDVLNLKDVVNIIVKKTNIKEPYMFILDAGDRRFKMMCHSFTDLDIWLRAIQTSRATITEQDRSALSTLKNINWILKRWLDGLMVEKSQRKNRRRL